MSVTGDSVLQAKAWMLTIEGRVIIELEELMDFSAALAVLFGCYHIFDVQYQEEAVSMLELLVLEYTSWCYLDMNPRS